MQLLVIVSSAGKQQTTFLLRFSYTYLAFVRTVARVHAHVHAQLGELRERRLADVTVERLDVAGRHGDIGSVVAFVAFFGMFFQQQRAHEGLDRSRKSSFISNTYFQKNPPSAKNTTHLSAESATQAAGRRRVGRVSPNLLRRRRFRSARCQLSAADGQHIVGAAVLVRDHVLLQLTAARKRALAAAARVRLDARMDAHVQAQPLLDRKRFRAVVALEAVRAAVLRGDVVLQAAGLSEALAAVLARIRPLIGVYAQMLAQVVAVLERFVADETGVADATVGRTVQ